MMRMNLLLVLLMLVCAGCPLTIKPETMTAQVVAPVHKSASEIAVAVFGATDISAKKPVHIADEDFTQALVSSIEASGLFRTVLRDASGKYQLQATFVRLDEQIFGLDMTASMEVNYMLASTTPKKILWEKGISTTHTTAFGESLISATRLRLATEGAARRNVEQAIQEISKLQLE